MLAGYCVTAQTRDVRGAGLEPFRQAPSSMPPTMRPCRPTACQARQANVAVTTVALKPNMTPELRPELELKRKLDHIAARDTKVRSVLDTHGYPEPRIRPHGFGTLLQIIVSQQLSTRVARVIWERVESLCENRVVPDAILASDEPALRECGLSRQKIGYARALAERIVSGRLDPDALVDMPTPEVIRELTTIRGYGVWSAEIYAMFALGREDAFPAGDLALQVAVQRLEGLAEKPGEKRTREIAARWSPYQSAAALMLWRYYGATTLSD